MSKRVTDGNQAYLKTISQHSVLKADEEKALLEACQKGDKKARDELINRNLRLVMFMTNRYKDITDLSRADLVQFGIIGLTEAIDRYKIGAGNQLASYASFWIRKEIENGVKGNTRQSTVSLDQPIDDDTDMTILGSLATENPNLIDAMAMQSTVKAILSYLPPRAADMIAASYGLNPHDYFDNPRGFQAADGKVKSREEIAQIYGISVSRVQSIINRSFKMLKEREQSQASDPNNNQMERLHQVFNVKTLIKRNKQT